MANGKTFWLTRRLYELNKTKLELATLLGINSTRLSELEKGAWRFQAAHIKKVAEFLEFDRTAFLDFISGDITEDELWNYTPPQKISEDDLNILKAVKTAFARQETSDASSDSQKSPTLQGKSRERNE